MQYKNNSSFKKILILFRTGGSIFFPNSPNKFHQTDLKLWMWVEKRTRIGGALWPMYWIMQFFPLPNRAEGLVSQFQAKRNTDCTVYTLATPPNSGVQWKMVNGFWYGTPQRRIPVNQPHLIHRLRTLSRWGSPGQPRTGPMPFRSAMADSVPWCGAALHPRLSISMVINYPSTPFLSAYFLCLVRNRRKTWKESGKLLICVGFAGGSMKCH